MWALPHLAGWSAMQAYWLVARKPRGPASLAAAITRMHSGFFRSRLAGQANAILVDRSLPTTPLSGVQISDEGGERRVVHAVRIDRFGVVANLHASNAVPDVVVRELVRARAFVDTRAAPDDARTRLAFCSKPVGPFTCPAGIGLQVGDVGGNAGNACFER